MEANIQQRKQWRWEMKYYNGGGRRNDVEKRREEANVQRFTHLSGVWKGEVCATMRKTKRVESIIRRKGNRVNPFGSRNTK